MDEFDQKMEISEQPQEEIVEKIPGRDVYETVSSLVSALLVVVLVFTFLVRLMGVSGPSMIPTLQDGDYVALLSNLFMGDLKQGDVIETGAQADIKPGNNLPLRNIPTGTVVHAIELRPLGGAKIARSAGAAVQLVAKDGAYAQLRMPSGEIRNVDARCRATVGEVGNSDHANIQLGKAGRARWMGKRPITRGESMNPVDHPHGGRTRGGKPPVSPWGKGEVRTRRPKKASNKMIVRRRPNGKNRK